MKKILAREVVLEKTPDSRESLKITIKASEPGGRASSSQDTSRAAAQARPIRLVWDWTDSGVSSPTAQKLALRR